MNRLFYKKGCSQLLRMVLACAVLLCGAAGSAWGETYYWVGGGTDSNFSTMANWNTAADGTGTTPSSIAAYSDLVVDSDSDVVFDKPITLTSLKLAGSGKKTFSSAVTCTSVISAMEGMTITVNAILSASAFNIPSPNNATNSFTVLVNGTSSLSVANMELYRPAATGASTTATSTVEFATTVTVSSTITLHSGVNLTIDSGAVVTAQTMQYGGTANATPASVITINGTLTCNDTFTTSASTNIKILVGSNGTLDSTNVAVANGNLTNNGTVVTTSDISNATSGDSTGTTVTVTSTTARWTGATDTDWATEGNWKNSIYPWASTTTDVYIPAVTNNPEMRSSTNTFGDVVATVETALGATLSVSTTVTIPGAVTNLGTIASSSGVLTFAGAVTNKGNLSSTGGSIICSGTTANNGTISSSGGALTFTRAVSGSGSISISANTTITATAGGTIALLTESTTGKKATVAAGSALSLTSCTGSVGLTLTGTGAVTLGSGTQNLGAVTVTDGSLATSGTVAAASVSVAASKSLTLGGAMTVSGALVNNGIIAAAGNTLSFATYSGSSGKVTVAGGTITATGAGGTITTLTVTDSATINGGSGTDGIIITNAVSNALTTSGKVTLNGTSLTTLSNSGTLTLNGALTTSDTLTNSGSIAVNSYALSFASYSGTSDKVTVAGGTITATGAGGTITTLTVTGSATINGGSGTDGIIITNAVSNALTTSGKVTLNGTSLTTLSNSGTLTLNGALTTSGTLTNSSSIAVNSYALSFASYSGTSDKVTVAGGTITATGTGGTIASLSATTSVAINGGSTGLTITSYTGGTDVELTTMGKVTFGSDVAVSKFTITNGSVSSSNTFTVSGSWLNSGTFTNSGSSVVFTADATISGSNTWGNFTCITGGKTIQFTAGTTQTVTAFTITGSSTSSRVTLCSTSPSNTWTIKVPVASASVSYAKVQDSVSTYASITPTSSVSGGNNTHWIFTESYTWTGTTSTEWALASNWKDSAGNTDTGYPGLSTGDTATIPYITATSNYPILGSALEITSLSIAGSASLTLSSTNNLKLDATSSPLKNTGTINYAGSGRIVNSIATAINDVNNNGTVAYTGTSGGTITDFNTGTASTDYDYYNLVVSGTGTFSNADTTIIVQKDFTSGTSAAVGYLGALSVGGISSIGKSITTTGAQTYTGAVTLTGSTVFTANSGTAPAMVIFGSTVKGTSGQALTIGASSAATNVSFGSAVGGSNYITTLTVYGTATLGSSCTSVTTTGAQTYSGAVTLGTNTIFTAGTNLVTFGSTVKGTSSSGQSLTIGASGTATNVSFGGIVGGSGYISTITVYGTTAFGSGCTAVTSTGAQTYTGDATIAANLLLAAGINTVSFGNTVKGTSGQSLTIGASGTATKASFGNTVGSSGYISAVTVYGSTTFGSSCASVITTGNQTYTGNATVAAATTTFLANNSGTAGTVTFSGTLKGSSVSREITIGSDYTDTTKQTNAVFGGTVGTSGSSKIGKLTVCGTAAINAAEVTTTDVQTYYGQVTAGADVTITANGGSAALVTFNGALISSASGRLVKIGSSSVNTNVAFNSTVGSAGKIKSLSVYGTTTINCATIINYATIRTTGNQVYSGTVTLSKDAVLVANSSGTANLITFNGNVSGAIALKIGISTETSNVKFTDKITISTASLYVSGTSVLGAAFVTTTGIQTYKDSVTLSGSSGISLSAGSTGVLFGSTVDSDAIARALTVSGTTPVKFTGAVGGGSALASLTIGTGTATINGASVTTTGAQTYGGVIDSTANTLTLTSTTSGNISFANTVLASSTGKTLVLSCASGSVTQTSDAVITAANLLLAGNGTFTLDTALNNIGIVAASSGTGAIALKSSAALTVKTVSLTNGITRTESTGTVSLTTVDKNITVSQTISLAASDLTLAAGTGAITVSADVSAKNIMLSSALTNSAKMTSTASITTSSSLTNNGTLTCGGTLTFSAAGSTYAGSGTNTLGNLAFTATGASDQLTISATAITVTGNISSSSTPASAGIYATTGTITQGNTTTATAATISGNNTFSTLALVGTGKTMFGGSNTFGTFTASGLGGKEIDFTAGTTQTITTSLSLSGTSSAKMVLNSTSSGSTWTIKKTDTATVSLVYLDVKDSTNTSTEAFTASDSTDEGNNVNWNFPGQTYTWTGASSTDWFTRGNWTPASIPGSGTKVIILDVSIGSNRYPVLTQATSVGSDGTITIDPSAQMTCAGQTVTAATLTNNGTLYLNGAETLTATKSNGTDAGSTVVYYGTAMNVTSAPWGTKYVNIKFPSGAAGTISSELNASGTTTIATGTGNALTLSSTSNTFTGGVTITSGGAVALYADANFTLAAGASCDSLMIDSAVTLAGNVTTTAASTGTQTYKKAVTLSGSAVLTTGNSAVLFGSTVGGGQSLSVAAGTGAVTFSGAVGTSGIYLGALSSTGSGAVTFGNTVYAASVAITDTTTVNTTAITTTGAQTYGGAVKMGASGEETFTGGSGSLVCFNGTLTGNSQNVTIATANAEFDDTVSGITDLTVGGTTTVNTTAITTTGAQIYGGAVTLGADLILTAGTTAGTGVVFKSTVNGAHNLTFASSTAATFNGAVGGTTPLATVTTVGTTAVNSSFKQNTAKSFIVSAGSVTVGTASFVCGALTLNSGSFTQTGDNGTNAQSVASITTAAGTTMDWDNGNNGGSITVTGDISASGALNFHYKSLTLSGTLSINGTSTTVTLLDLTVNNGGKVSVSSGCSLTVMRNVTLKSTSTFSNSGTLYLTNSTVSSPNGTIADYNSTQQNLGTVTVTQGTTTKTFSTAITAKTLTMSDTTSSAGAITFQNALTVTTLTNGTGTSFALTLNGTPTITRTSSCSTVITNACTLNTSGAVTIGTLTGDSATFMNGLSVPNGSVSLAGTISTATSGTGVSFSKAVTLTAATVVNTSSANGTVQFGSTVDGGSALTVTAGSGAVTFTGAVGSISAIGNLKVTTSGGITASGTVSVGTGKTVTLTGAGGAVKLNGAVTAPGGFSSTGTTFSSAGTITTTGTALSISHTGDVTVGAALSSGNSSAGDVTVTSSGGTVTVNGSVTSGTGALTVSGTGSGKAVAISGALTATSGKVTVSSADTLTITNAITTTTGNVTVDSTGIATLNDAGDITTTTGNVTFGGTSAGTLLTAGNITTSGVTASGNGAVVFTRAVTLTGPVVITTNNSSTGGEVAFNGNVTGGTQNLTVSAGSGAVNIPVNMGTSSVPLGAVSITGGTVTFGVSTSNTHTVYASILAVAHSGLLRIYNGQTIAVGSFTESGNGTLQVAGAITASSGSVTFTCSNPLYIDGATTLTASAAVTTAGDMYVAAGSGNAVSITGTAFGETVGGSLVLFTGTLTLGNNLTTGKDLVLLNGNAGTMYDDTTTNNTTDSVSGVTGLFAYIHASRDGSSHVKENVTSFPTAYPDGTPFPNGTTTEYSGSVTPLSSLNVTVGKNFYDNGVDLSGTGWILYIPDNNSQLSAFAEAYRMAASNCTVYQTGTTTTAYVSAAEGCTVTNCTGWATARLTITAAATVYDDVVKITCSEPIENTNKEISTAASHIQYSKDGTITPYVATYIDADCTTSTDGKGDLSEFYLKAGTTWNTDATGISAGITTDTTTAGAHYDKSTDRQGVEKVVIPYLNLPKALSGLYETLRDNSKNRIGHYYSSSPSVGSSNNAPGATYTAVTDHCAPVLVAVYAGQELHTEYSSTTGVDSQPEYDAHNFIEFQYSESVDIGNLPAVTADAITYADEKNLRAEASFNSVSEHGGAITDNASGITVAGYATIASGEVTAGERTLSGSTYTGATSTTIHSLYRKFSTVAQEVANDTVQTHRIRVSIAGYVDGTVKANSNIYHNWNGYITSSTMPSGKVTRIANSYITDLANTALDASGAKNHSLPTISVNALVKPSDSATTLYGSWDSSRPEFALYFMKKTSDSTDTDQIWSNGSTLYQNASSDSQFEIIGTTATTTSSYLDRVEFHVFDNTPSYSFSADPYNWVSKNGWYAGESATTPTEYAADISGGSRSTASKGNANRTSGGVRRSSLDKANNSFTYVSSASDSSRSFSSKDILQTIKSPFFTYSNDAALATTPPNDDSLYFALFLNNADTDLALSTTFTITYDDATSFITDLAGNLITNTGTGKMSSIDRVVPRFSLDVAAVGKDKLYMVFSKRLATSIQNDFTILSNALEFITMKSSPTSASATTVSNLSFTGEWVQKYTTASVTCVEFTLNRAITLSDIENTWIRVKKPSSTKIDPVTAVEAYVTDIQDNYGNYMPYYSCHALSDFAVNAVIPTYAKDLSDNLTTGADGVSNLHTIQKFDGNGTNTNRMLTGCDIELQVNIADARDSSNAATKATDNKAKVYFDSSITGTKADLYNKRTGAEQDVWLPIALPSFNTTANEPENASGLEQRESDSTDSSLRYYTIHDKSDGTEADSFGWKSKDVIQFIFSLTDSNGNDITIDNDGDQNSSTVNVPLYALRLSDEDDITSFDLWQFSMVSKKLQRGGVTILNNVINPNNGDETVVQVDADAGNLIVAVMTLDGNVIKYLEHGKVEAGTHYYRWNGKNNAGNSVARGLYFVRVVGEGIDETRKVMVVK